MYCFKSTSYAYLQELNRSGLSLFLVSKALDSWAGSNPPPHRTQEVSWPHRSSLSSKPRTRRHKYKVYSELNSRLGNLRKQFTYFYWLYDKHWIHIDEITVFWIGREYQIHKMHQSWKNIQDGSNKAYTAWINWFNAHLKACWFDTSSIISVTNESLCATTLSLITDIYWVFFPHTTIAEFN